MNKYVSTVTTTAIHRKGTSPIFSNGTMIVSIDDEGAGPYVKLSEVSEEVTEPGVVSFDDIEQMQAALNAAKSMLAAVIKAEKP